MLTQAKSSDCIEIPAIGCACGLVETDSSSLGLNWLQQWVKSELPTSWKPIINFVTWMNAERVLNSCATVPMVGTDQGKIGQRVLLYNIVAS